jgi:UDP-3-O-[3-hydroxymyristoyl] glucosamine N-acyltransferase
MIIGNNKPIRVIGYAESSMTHEIVGEISRTSSVSVIGTQDFLNNPDFQFQYIVSVSVDFEERKNVIDTVDDLDLDLITVISDQSLVGNRPAPVIQPGTFIFPFCSIGLGATIGRHCIISAYSMIGHYSTIGCNCVLRPGVMITDKSLIGNNCVFNIRSTVTNRATIVDNVELMAFANVAKNITVPGRYIGSTARKFIGS